MSGASEVQSILDELLGEIVSRADTEQLGEAARNVSLHGIGAITGPTSLILENTVSTYLTDGIGQDLEDGLLNVVTLLVTALITQRLIDASEEQAEQDDITAMLAIAEQQADDAEAKAKSAGDADPNNWGVGTTKSTAETDAENRFFSSLVAMLGSRTPPADGQNARS